MSKDYAFHPRVTNPEKWEVIKREAAKAGRDPYKDLLNLANEDKENSVKFKLRGAR